MNPVFLSSPILLFLFLNLPLFSTSSLYSSCSNNFTCGDGVSVGFPFWGGDRPEDCGHPALKLTCVEAKTILEIIDVKYLVLNISESTKTLSIVRTDFLNGICSPEFPPSTFDSNLFYTGSAYHYVFGYNCDQGPLTLLSCNENERVYLWTVPPSQMGVDCKKSSVVVYFSRSINEDTSDKTKIEEDVKKGFNVTWKINDENCRICDGVCGFDSRLYESTCYSPPTADGPPSSSSAKEGVEKSKLPLISGLAAGCAAIFCIILGCIFCVAQRRKKKNHGMLEKQVSLHHFNNGVSTPTSNLSQSIPSFPFSKSDLEFGSRSTNYGGQVFNYSELEEATKNFDPSLELGEGGFGTVYYGKLHDGREVAVKRLYENNLKRVEQFMNELQILARLHHPNLVKLYGSTSRRSQELLLVYEYIPKGTVADHLHGKQAGSKLLDWHHRLRIAVQTADALTYLHRCEVVHRDVKTNNILLDSNFQVKVADFGLSRLFPTNVTHVSTAPQGTPGYVDPEYYQVYQLTDKSDVFSFGVVLIELISSLQAVDTSRHRHDINLSNMALNKIQTGALSELVDPTLGFDTDFCTRRMITSVSELAFQCLQQDKELRPSMVEVLECLRGINNEELGTTNAEVVDIQADDVRLLKNMPPPLSPESVVTEKWSSSTQASSF